MKKQIPILNGLVCKLKDRPVLLLVLAALALLIFFLLRRWLWILLLSYLALLTLLGLLVLVRLVQSRLRKRCWKSSASPKGGGSEGHPPSKGINVPPHTYKRPDPMIYSQFYLMSKGLAITWDNPDIQLFDETGPVSSHGLKTGKTYNIRARIWNGSVDAPAVNVAVRFHYLSFGIGTVKNYIGQTLVDVPVKGAAPLGTTVEHAWTTPLAAGHYCIQVELVWADDANPNNNLGQENVDVQKLNSPKATFQFTLRNDGLFPRELKMVTDAYSIPARPPCPPAPAETRPGPSRREAESDPYANHRRGAHPMPDGWRLDYQTGDVVALAPGEEKLITLKVIAPDGFVGRQTINVNAFEGIQLAGGVTLYAQS